MLALATRQSNSWLVKHHRTNDAPEGGINKTASYENKLKRDVF